MLLSCNYEEFTAASCRKRSKYTACTSILAIILNADSLKSASQAICCITQVQYEAIIDLLVKTISTEETRV